MTSPIVMAFLFVWTRKLGRSLKRDPLNAPKALLLSDLFFEQALCARLWQRVGSTKFRPALIPANGAVD